MPPAHCRAAAAFTRQAGLGLQRCQRAEDLQRFGPGLGWGPSVAALLAALTRANSAFIRAPEAGAARTHELLGSDRSPCTSWGFWGIMRLPESRVGILMWTHTLPEELRCVQGALCRACSNMESAGPALRREGSTSNLSSGEPDAGNPWLRCSGSPSALLCECFTGIKLPHCCRRCSFTTTKCTAPVLASQATQPS